MKLIQIATKIVFIAITLLIAYLGLLCVLALIASSKFISAFLIGSLTIFAILDCIGVFD